MTKPDGGPAFPIVYQHADGSPDWIDGMTLRDYFAAAALQGLLAESEWPSVEGAASAAYQYADAMLAERDK